MSQGGAFKGILLCARPNAPPDVPKKKPAFYAMCPPSDPAGLVPTKPLVAQSGEKKKVNEAMQNHAQFLRDLKAKVKAQKQEAAEKEREEDEKRKRRRKQALRQRQMIEAKKRAQSAALEASGPSEPLEPVDPEAGSDATPAALAAVDPPAALAKPAWARVADDDLPEVEDEADDLLNWVEQLDWDSYVADDVFKTELKRLVERSKELNSVQDAWINSLAGELQRIEAAKEAKTSAPKRAADQSTVDDDARSNADDAASVVSHARSVLSQNSKMRAIHSERSAKAVVDRVAQQERE